MEKQSVKELKKLAKDQGIKGYYRLRKAELIEALGNIDTPRPITELEPIPEDKTKKNKYKCVHGRFKYYCKDCGGSRICSHNLRKNRCRECDGSSICEHDRMRNVCKECGGSQICIHGKQIWWCRLCICKHNRRKEQCKECHTTQETQQKH